MASVVWRNAAEDFGAFTRLPSRLRCLNVGSGSLWDFENEIDCMPVELRALQSRLLFLCESC